MPALHNEPECPEELDRAAFYAIVGTEPPVEDVAVDRLRSEKVTVWRVRHIGWRTVVREVTVIRSQRPNINNNNTQGEQQS